jgi:AsmA protein
MKKNRLAGAAFVILGMLLLYGGILLLPVSEAALSGDRELKSDAAGKEHDVLLKLLAHAAKKEGNLAPEGSGLRISYRGFRFKLKKLSLDRTVGNTLRAVTFNGRIDIESLQVGDMEITNVSVPIEGEPGRFTLYPAEVYLHGTKGTARLDMDFTKEPAEHQLEFGYPGIPLSAVYLDKGKDEAFSGSLDVSMKASFQSGGAEGIMNTLDGTLTIEGEDLIQHGFDLDKFLDAYKETQKFKLTDVGAFVFAGPIGVLLTEGYDAAALGYATMWKGEGEIRELSFRWKFEDGIAHAEDVAFSTRRNRVAFQGNVDLMERRYDRFRLALVDKDGCAAFVQEVSGPIDSPTFGKVGIMKTYVTGPLRDIWQKMKGVVVKEKCEAFYDGTVEHPEKGKSSAAEP